MKAWMIKLGKAIETVKRDGIFNGGKKLINFLFSYFGSMKKLSGGDVLFITNGVGDSALYRSHHVSEELNLHGFKSFVTISESPYLLSYAETFKIFIFQKVSYDERIKNLIEKIKSQNKEIIFETDDLVFDSKYFQEMGYLQSANVLQKKQYSKGIGEEILEDSYVKVCTASTSYLAEKLKEYGKKVFVVPNKLSKKDVEVAEKIMEHGTWNMEQDKIKLGYFSGTIGHNKDFAEITEALMEIMEKYPDVELHLVGPLDVESEFIKKFRNRIKQLPYVPREKHFEIFPKWMSIWRLWKSAILSARRNRNSSFLKPGIVGVPTVASATETFKEAISDGIDGFVALDTGKWIEGLQRLILEPNLRREMGEKAREKALNRYTTQNSNNVEYYNYLRSRL